MSQCTSPQIFTRIGLKYKHLATKASRTAHPSTEFKAHTHSSHPRTLLLKHYHGPTTSMIQTCQICLPNYVRSSVSSQILNMCTPTQGTKTYKHTVYQTTLSSRFPSVLHRMNCACMSNAGLAVDCEFPRLHLCPANQTHTQHPLLPHLVHLSERTVVHKTKTADLHTAHKRSPRSKHRVPKIPKIYQLQTNFPLPH